MTATLAASKTELPEVRGRLTMDAPLDRITWFRVGGAADVMFRPADIEDLAHFLAGIDPAMPVMVLGVGSNVLIRDGGIRGAVVRLGRGFADISADGTTVTAGAGALCANVARVAAEAGLGGLEFLSGVPGTIGGALRMNAGAYGREVKDVLSTAELVERGGRRCTVPLAEIGYSYRHCGIDESAIFTGARLEATAEDSETVIARMREIAQAREESQPLRTRTGGSTFRNPPDHKAWQLIDQAGCRGLTIGSAEVSTKHCNFLINTGSARAADLEKLGETVRERVHAMSGIELQWEIRRLGQPGHEEKES